VTPFEGTWEDPATAGHTYIRVQMRGDVPVVTSIKESIGDLETYEIESSRFVDGELRWVYYVPSTGYRVEFAATLPNGESLPCTWSNSAGASGKTDLVRVRDKPKREEGD
jgi:hypothetical protein